MHDNDFSTGTLALLAGLGTADRNRAGAILVGCETVELHDAARYADAFPHDALLLVEEGFVVVRGSVDGSQRWIVTCDAAAGELVLPPTSSGAVFGLGRTGVAVIANRARSELLEIAPVAERIVALLAESLAHKHEASLNFASPRHLDRVRRKLLQLGRTYGHVVRGGVRIDFPVSHALLAEMIGSSRETVTRAVDELQRRGFVERRGSTYLLLGAADTVFAPLQQ